MILTQAVGDIPTWLGAIATAIVIITALGAAVAVYKTSVQGTSLREARATIADLRGEISDGERRETRLESELSLCKQTIESDERRIKVLEDLLTRRQDDEEIRSEIAAVKKVVDENVMTQLTAIVGTLDLLKAVATVAVETQTQEGKK